MDDLLALMSIQAEVLYIHDSEGRMTAINERSCHPAPRLFWGQTRQGSVLRFRNDVPDVVVHRIVQIMKDGEASVQMAGMLDELQRYGRVHNVWLGPAYVFEEGTESRTRDQAVKVTDENRAMLGEGLPEAMGWCCMQ